MLKRNKSNNLFIKTQAFLNKKTDFGKNVNESGRVKQSN